MAMIKILKGTSNRENDYLPLPDGALCLIASTAFCAEYFLFYFHSTTHQGLEGYYHLILVILIGLCIFSTVAGALMPTSFPVDLFNGIVITLQGLWFYQTAFTLYGPMMPNGCWLKADQIACRSKESEIRGELLANFQLFSQVLGVLVATIGAYCFAHSVNSHTDLRSSQTPEDG
nr:transmembrane protein 45A-like [Coffea arabica]